jgi:RNA polymerase sporulation-specific sigma factor
MIAATWLMLSGLFYSLQLSTGSFPKPLTEEEERHFLALASQGDLEARNILIERNLRLVAHIMKKYYTQDSDQEDLISIGTIGLIKGISTFDGSKGARLATYAARCVENAILTPTTLRILKRHPQEENGHFGAFWTVLPMKCGAFARLRILV